VVDLESTSSFLKERQRKKIHVEKIKKINEKKKKKKRKKKKENKIVYFFKKISN